MFSPKWNNGLIGAIQHINKICSTYKVPEGAADIGFDILEAYKLATRYAYALSTKLSHYDLSSTLHQLIKTRPLYCKYRHIKVHEDDRNTYNNIYEWGQINIEAYWLAKDYLWRQIHAGATHQTHKAISRAIQPTTMKYQNSTYTITSYLAKTIKNITSKYRSLKYWSSHNRDISNVLTDMPVFQHAATDISIWKQWWMSKHSWFMCGVGKWIEHWK